MIIVTMTIWVVHSENNRVFIIYNHSYRRSKRICFHLTSFQEHYHRCHQVLLVLKEKKSTWWKTVTTNSSMWLLISLESIEGELEKLFLLSQFWQVMIMMGEMWEKRRTSQWEMGRSWATHDWNSMQQSTSNVFVFWEKLSVGGEKCRKKRQWNRFVRQSGGGKQLVNSFEQLWDCEKSILLQLISTRVETFFGVFSWNARF